MKNNNARLTTALQESTSNVEEWKKQLAMYKEESARMRKRVSSEYTKTKLEMNKICMSAHIKYWIFKQLQLERLYTCYREWLFNTGGGEGC